MYINISEMMSIKGRLIDINGELKTLFSKISNELSTINSNLQTNNLVRSNQNIKDQMAELYSILDENVTKLTDFLEEQIDAYETNTEEAKMELESLVSFITNVFGDDGIIKMKASAVQNSPNTSNVSNPSTTNSAVDTSIYNENKAIGFEITTNHPTYDLSDTDKNFMYSLVAAEAINDYDDALAVSSVILNRADSNNMTPREIMVRPNQFEAYTNKNYLKYENGSVAIPEKVKRAVDDALKGIRNCNYYSFRSNYCTDYSANQIVEGGNRFN